LVRTHEELEKILAHSPNIKFIAQSYFPNKCDYRILCAGDSELVIRRTAVGNSHLNNTSQGGSAELVASEFLPVKAIEEAHLIASSLKMSIAGVDLLYNEETQEYSFLEVNSQPQLKSGAFTKEKQQLVSGFLRSLLD
jgi:glutathione synthase/RimK-type ligase-like ATP-grasp enzyme